MGLAVQHGQECRNLMWSEEGGGGEQSDQRAHEGLDNCEHSFAITTIQHLRLGPTPGMEADSTQFWRIKAQTM